MPQSSYFGVRLTGRRFVYVIRIDYFSVAPAISPFLPFATNGTSVEPKCCFELLTGRHLLFLFSHRSQRPDYQSLSQSALQPSMTRSMLSHSLAWPSRTLGGAIADLRRR